MAKQIVCLTFDFDAMSKLLSKSLSKVASPEVRRDRIRDLLLKKGFGVRG